MIEIIGFPGSGKSYLLNQLDDNKLFKMNEDKFYNECKKIKNLKKIITSIAILIKYFDIHLSLVLYMIISSKNKLFFFKQNIRLFKYLVLFNIIHQNNKNKNKIIYDQGIIQMLWSMTLFDNTKLKYNRLLAHAYSRFKKIYNIKILYYMVDYRLAAQRATNREKKCETDYYTIEKLTSLYKLHSQDYNIISKMVNNNIQTIYNIEDLTKYCNITNN